jgi:hypothetical protein
LQKASTQKYFIDPAIKYLNVVIEHMQPWDV